MWMRPHCCVDNCGFRFSKWILEDAKEFDEEACFKRCRERWTVDIVERSQWLLAGAVDEYGRRDNLRDEDNMDEGSEVCMDISRGRN